MTYDEERALAQVAHAAIIEVRRQRRWRIFFRLIWLMLILFFVYQSLMDNAQEKSYNRTTAHIAVVNVNGIIAADAPANAHDIDEALDKAFKNQAAQAVILAINSPGGSPVQAGEVFRTIQRLKKRYPKKIYAVISDVGASGAYFIAAAADEIYADPASIVGSIGVISQSIGVEGLMDKLGIQGRTFKAGKYKDFLNPTKPLIPAEVAHMNLVLDDVHQQFINAVKQGRGTRLVHPEQNELFSGLFWTGQQAQKLGLIDGLASVRELVNHRYHNEMPIIVYSPNLTPWQQLFREMKSEFSLKIGTLFGAGKQINTILAE